MSLKTADLYDTHSTQLQIAGPIFIDFGGRPAFHGAIATVKVFEDNVLVRAALSEAGTGRVLVVDGGGSRRCALVGDQLAALALANGWTGIVVYGCVRDTDTLDELDLGIKALAAHPARSVKRGEGQRDIPVHFADVTFRSGDMLYADRDGIVLAAKPLV